ncbi:hypothetical protein B0H63DRAFT_547580 [Podospora didyma]|uniref:Uncharacterized protein n=1 Tax=Podospora didyma TaxID=330526 RepID=A0AAE0KKV4_9PEZI|nr:hypothetical protein B0H63DRAFT_547580 [Podospora didyma]
MKLSPILFLSAVFGSAMAQSITLPDLPDGSYIISIGSDGKPTEGPTSQPTSPLRVLLRPPCGSAMNDFYNYGWNAFYNMCAAGGSHKWPQGTVITQYQGTSVTYMCSYTTNPCSTAEWADAVNWASGNCIGRSNGWMEPGYLHVPAWNKRYGYAKSGSSIC